jgi:phosphinothricin acetyltransferase
MDVDIGAMAPADWESVRAIYQEGIASGQATFETEAPSWQEWDAAHHPFARLVARAGGHVAGWAALSPVSRRSCYAGVAEVSVYVAAAHRGLGIGRRLLLAVIAQAERHDIWTLQGATFPQNEASLRLQRACGFRELGKRERIARHRGAWQDTILTERRSRIVGAGHDGVAPQPIERGAIALEPFEPGDAGRLCSWVTSPHLLLQWSGPAFQDPLTTGQIETHLANARNSGGTHEVYRARDLGSGEVIGHAELAAISRHHRCARIGRILVGPPDRRGLGLGRGILVEVLHRAFTDLQLHRVELAVYDFNHAALRCYEGLGFRREGVRRECVRFGQEYWNSVQMGLLEREWAQLTLPKRFGPQVPVQDPKIKEAAEPTVQHAQGQKVAVPKE